MHRVSRKIVAGLALLLLLVPLIGGCASTGQTPAPSPTARSSSAHTSSPTQAPRSMVRVTLMVTSIQCNGKVSVWALQLDNPYLLTTFVGSGALPRDQVLTQSQVSRPVEMNNNQELPPDPHPFVAFSALLPLDGTLRGGLTLYDEGISADEIAQFASWGIQIAQRVGNDLLNEGVDSGQLPQIVGAIILNLAAQTFLSLLSSSDNPLELGHMPLEIAADGPASFTDSMTFIRNDGPGHTWNYVVGYTITRAFVTI